MKRFIVTIAIFVSLFLLCGCANCSSCNNPQPASFEINFIVDGEQYLSDKVIFGKTIEKPVIEEKQGYVFKGWYITEDYVEEWDFEKPVYSSVTLYAYWVEAEKETFNVIYTDDGNPIHTEKVFKGSCAEKFIPEEKEGYIFSDWTYSGQAYDFSTPVNCDIALTAVWTAIQFKITFIADEQVVSEEYFTADNLFVNIPELPEKEHYTGKWETFIYEFKDFEVQAIYTAIPYTATFYVDDEIYREFTYTVEDEVNVPEVPSKIGYSGVWNGLPIAGGNVTINAVYTLIEYTITYKISGEVIDTRTYSVEVNDITPPDIPEIPGYEGHWEEIELDIGDKTVNAYYVLKKLYAYFYVDGELYETRTFTVENKHINEPDIPHKEGYTGTWESYKLGNEDMIINAIYTKEVYTATFKINEELIESKEFTVDTKFISAPKIPERYQLKGYTVHWKDYTLGTQDIIINAEYIPIKYNAEFVIDGQVIDSSEFTLEDEKLNEPSIPDKFHKDGYTVNWEHYTLDSGNISIEAVYTPIIYTAGFMIDDQIIDEVQFTVKDTYINEPEITSKYQKKGYTARWKDYSIIADDIVINIEYELITYYASFMLEDKLIEKVPYTIKDTEIKEPIPPQKDNYVAVWDEYIIPYEDFEIRLQYFEIMQTETVGNLQFELSEDGKTYYLKTYNVDYNLPLGTPELKVEIPSEVNHIPVTAIAENAFAYKTNFNEIIIPDSVTEIGNYAFSRTSIEDIKLPSKLTRIKNIFVSCANLKSVTIPANVKYIDDNAFWYCASLTEIIIPESVKHIGANAFNECTSLKNVIFENCDNWHIYKDPEYQVEIKNTPELNTLSEYLSNPSNAAEYLTATYKVNYWENSED